MTVLYLHKAAKKLGLHPKILKADIRNGKLHMDGDGCVDCDELQNLYPLQWANAVKDNKLEYYDAVKATCGNWKNGARESMEQLEKHHLVNTIRKLEAEIYRLQQVILHYETLVARKN